VAGSYPLLFNELTANVMLAKLLVVASAAFLLGACTSQNGEDLLAAPGPLPTPSCDISHVTYTLTVAPILQQNCGRCHGGTAGAGGVDITAYAKVKAIAADGRLLGTVNHDPGFSPMPKGGAKLSDCDISKLRKWVDDGALNN
jgi:mono/diheme cytochrome c family protein